MLIHIYVDSDFNIPEVKKTQRKMLARLNNSKMPPIACTEIHVFRYPSKYAN